MKPPAIPQRPPHTWARDVRAFLWSAASLCALVYALFCCSDVHAQLNRQSAPPPPPRPAPTSVLVIEHARYEATFAGVRAYMAELAETDPGRHRLLEPTFAALRRRRRAVAGTGAAFVVMGLTAIALALSFDDDLGRTTRIGTMYSGATATFVGGAMLGVLGGRHDAERFVEAHQRLVPRARLHIEFSGGARSAQVWARARF